MLLLAIFGSAFLYNCEPDPDSLGEQLFNGDAAQGNEIAYPVIAYNYDNNDSIRSDASRLISGLRNQVLLQMLLFLEPLLNPSLECKEHLMLPS